MSWWEYRDALVPLVNVMAVQNWGDTKAHHRQTSAVRSWGNSTADLASVFS